MLGTHAVLTRKARLHPWILSTNIYDTRYIEILFEINDIYVRPSGVAGVNWITLN